MNKNLPDKQSNFLLYTGSDGQVNVEVFLKDENIWLTQKAIGELFGKERSVIIWATKTLKEYIIKGFVLDDEQLKQGNQVFGRDYFDKISINSNQIRTLEKLRDTLLPKLMGGEVRVEYENN